MLTHDVLKFMTTPILEIPLPRFVVGGDEGEGAVRLSAFRALPPPLNPRPPGAGNLEDGA